MREGGACHGAAANRRDRPRLVRRDPLSRRSSASRTSSSPRCARARRSGSTRWRRSSAWRKTYRDYHDLLADPDIDAVSIVTMWDQHTEPALAALAAGKHVFLEKPMASTVADCEAIIARVDDGEGHPARRPHLPLQPALPDGQAGDREGHDRAGSSRSARAATSLPPGRPRSSTRSARSSATRSTTPT